MALFTLADGITLEIHIPHATDVAGSPSAAREAGFILRRDKEVLNVGGLARLLQW